MDDEELLSIEEFLELDPELTLEEFKKATEPPEETMTLAEYLRANFTGPQGERGIQGQRGPRGARGERGEKGDKGDKGDPGEQGAQGPPGERGIEGKQGPRGFTGLTGKDGPAGVRGATGADGKQGPQGERGPMGLQGYPGKDGVQGPMGPRGYQGPEGKQGPPGEEGPPGKSPEVAVDAEPNVPSLRRLGFGPVDAAPGNHWHHMPESQHARRHGMRLGIDPILPRTGTANGKVLAFNDASPDWLEWIDQVAGTGGGGGTVSLSDSTPQTVGTAGSAGNGGSASRSNHAHAHGTIESGNHHPEYSGTAHSHGADHSAVTLAASADGILDLSGQAIGFDSQAANRVLASPDGGAGTPTFRALVDADIPSSIARDSEVTSAILTHEAASDPHPTYTTVAEAAAIAGALDHSPVTLQASGDGILDLSGQALGFDSQAANKVLASPDGSSGTPSFRSLGTADLPTIPHSFLGSIGANDHHAQAHALTSGDHTGQLPFGSLSGSLTGTAQHGSMASGNLHPEYSGTGHTHPGGASGSINSGLWASRPAASSSNLGSEYMATDRANTRYRVNSATAWEIVSPAVIVFDWYLDGRQRADQSNHQGPVRKLPLDMGSWAPVNFWGRLSVGPAGTTLAVHMLHGTGITPSSDAFSTAAPDNRLTFATGATAITGTAQTFANTAYAAGAAFAPRIDRVGSTAGTEGEDLSLALHLRQIDS